LFFILSLLRDLDADDAKNEDKRRFLVLMFFIKNQKSTNVGIFGFSIPKGR
jgi:hypothetical protein